MNNMNLEFQTQPVDMNSWRLPENQRWAFQHMAEILPTATISRGDGQVAQLPEGHRDLDSVILPPVFAGEVPMSVGSVMATTETDGWMLLHRGQVLTEQYFGGMGAGTQHLPPRTH